MNNVCVAGSINMDVSSHLGRVFFNLGANCGKRENRTA